LPGLSKIVTNKIQKSQYAVWLFLIYICTLHYIEYVPLLLKGPSTSFGPSPGPSSDPSPEPDPGPGSRPSSVRIMENAVIVNS